MNRLARLLEVAMQTPGVPSALAAARDSVDAVIRDRGLRRTEPTATAESLLRGAVSSARLSGSESDDEAIRAGLGDPISTGAVRLSSELLALVPVIARSPHQAFARMHALASADLAPADERGRPRPGGAAARLLTELGGWLLDSTAAPGLAVAAVAHAELLTAQPFETANDLVARAVERLLLVARGVDPASVTVPEAGHLGLQREYRGALDAYAEGSAMGLRRWFEHVCAAVQRGTQLSPVAAKGS